MWAQATNTVNSQEQVGLCRISGMVVTAGAAEPLRKARLRLQSTVDRSSTISATTNLEGRFELSGIAPGRYKLYVTRVGYVTQVYGQRKPSDPGADLTLRPGQDIKDLIFRMIPWGVIAGRIMDEDGEPLPGIFVTAFHEVYSRGKRQLQISNRAQTDDRGGFRLFALAPGRYLVSALNSDRQDTDDEPEGDRATAQGYARMYFPGTPEWSKATPLTLKGGEEIPAIDILMRQIPTRHVRGRVYNQITHGPGVGASVFLVAKNSDKDGEFGEQETEIGKPDGSFNVSNVLPGSYVLAAFWFNEGMVYNSRTLVDVGNADVDGLAVTITAGVQISGRIIWDGNRSEDELSVYLTPADVPTGESNTRVARDGTFLLKNVGEGIYYATVKGQSKDCYVKEVQYAGSSTLNEGFTVAAGSPGSLEITISSRGARLQGRVANQDGLPATGVWVVLVPDGTRSPQYWLYRSQITDQYGHFDFHGIAPGDYRVYSWDDVVEGAWEDPDFIKPFVEKSMGEKISVSSGDTKLVDLVTIQSTTSERGGR